MIKLNTQTIINNIEDSFINKNLPKIGIGDNVRIGVKIQLNINQNI